MKTKFIHCADLHLGCFPNKNETRFEDFFNAFTQVIDYAIKEDIKLILISGDFFHLKVINSKILIQVTQILKKAKDENIEIIVIEGNHDKAFYGDDVSWLSYLHEEKLIHFLKHSFEGNKLLINEQSIYENENFRITGIGYLGSQTDSYIKNIVERSKKTDKFSILMMHASVASRLYKDFGSISNENIKLLKTKFDYFALGHVHNKYEYDEFSYNPGSLENIRISDQKYASTKGFFVVSVEDMEKNVEYVVINNRKIHFQEVDVTGLNSLLEIYDCIYNQNYDIKENEILSLLIRGKTAINSYLIDINEISTKLKEKYQLLEIEIENYVNHKNINSLEKLNVLELESSVMEEILRQQAYSSEDIPKVLEQLLELKRSISDSKELETVASVFVEEK